MLVLRSTRELLKWRKSISAETQIGFVPTMGALHAGHGSLLTKARSENNLVILSIFVNPTQFNQASDFEKYPKTWDADVEQARAAGVDVIFSPSAPTELYPEGYRFEVREKEFSKELCGAFRPGHFEGVLTIVMKLLNLVQADRAYFGEKDYQQFSLIRDMARDFFLTTQIIPCETVREESGLAMSSRNVRLSPAGRVKASALHRNLISALTVSDGVRDLQSQGFEVEYFEQKHGRRFVAAWLEGVRLIDNVEVPQFIENSRERLGEVSL